MVALTRTSVSRNIPVNLFHTLKVPSRLYRCIYGNSQILSLICIRTIARGVCAIQSYITPPRHVCAIPPPRNLSQSCSQKVSGTTSLHMRNKSIARISHPLGTQSHKGGRCTNQAWKRLVNAFYLRPSSPGELISRPYHKTSTARSIR